MALWIGIALLALGACFVWYWVAAEAYIQRLKDILAANGIDITEEHYGLERK